jgi:hypothetical protein
MQLLDDDRPVMLHLTRPELTGNQLKKQSFIGCARCNSLDSKSKQSGCYQGT